MNEQPTVNPAERWRIVAERLRLWCWVGVLNGRMWELYDMAMEMELQDMERGER